MFDHFVGLAYKGLKKIIHLVRIKTYPKNQYYLPPDTHTCGCPNDVV